MVKEIEIKLNIEFPEYKDLKAAIDECKRKWDKNDFEYDSEATYKHTLCTFPSGSYRIYSSEDVNFKISFDEMQGRFVNTFKTFDLNKKGYEELIEYAIEKINRAIREW